MKTILLKYYICGLVKLLSNSGIQQKLKNVGRDLANKIVLIYDIKPDNDALSLLFRISYELFPKIYKASRALETSEMKNVYYLIEKIGRDDVVDCFEFVLAGIIEAILGFSGFNTSVNAYNYLDERKIVYEIEIICNNSFEL